MQLPFPRQEHGQLIGADIDRHHTLRNISRIGRQGGKKGQTCRKAEPPRPFYGNPFHILSNLRNYGSAR
ncbi:Hypothetical protein BSPT2_I1365 [Brucella suis bv. 2]|nr:Hypothetical protein BSPT2_I1365 [Brucella suis bv. 2]